LLASLEKKSIYGELDYFLEDDLADEATEDEFFLFWKATALLVVEALPCFQK